MLKKLQSAGYKLTKPRLAILAVLEKQKQPLSAGQIHLKLKKRFDLVSVYRNLEVFKKAGLVFAEQSENETKYYMDEAPHHHITCQFCGLIECFPCHHQFKVKNFANIRHKLSLVGTCLKCSKN